MVTAAKIDYSPGNGRVGIYAARSSKIPYLLAGPSIYRIKMTVKRGKECGIVVNGRGPAYFAVGFKSPGWLARSNIDGIECRAEIYEICDSILHGR